MVKEIGKCKECGKPILEMEGCCGDPGEKIFNCSCNQEGEQ